jgi:dienelactone hydrolase
MSVQTKNISKGMTQIMTNKPIVYSKPGMREISPQTDIVYKYLGSDRLHADLYLPRAPAPVVRSPLVIFIHGAVPRGVEPKEWASYVSWGQLIASSGMAAITFNHSLLWSDGYDPDGLLAGATDTGDLIAFVRDNSDSLNLDPDRIGLVAFSAGGPLLAAPLADSHAYLRCVVGFYSYLGEPLPADSHDAGRFSPSSALRRDTSATPVFVAKAGLDQPEINDSIDDFVDTARSLRREVSLVFHPSGQHGFDIMDDDATSRAIIRQSVEFMKSHLLG